MPEEILPGLYRIKVPLPNNPLKYLNSYLIRGDKRNLLVDTGQRRDECREAIRSGLEALDVRLEETDFFLTHLHSDHSGLIAELVSDDSTVYFNQSGAAQLTSGDAGWTEMERAGQIHGFPSDELRTLIEHHPGKRYGNQNLQIPFQFVEHGQELRVGEYRFRCVRTPGHTEGHTCLYEPAREVLVAGDHILREITPNISAWTHEQRNPLGQYLESLDSVKDLAVQQVLPGHRRLFDNLQDRVEELQAHHHDRLEQVEEILGERDWLTGYEVASFMEWDFRADHWEEFPPMQRWFATGEALAHLVHLEAEGVIRRDREQEPVVFALAS